MRRKPRRTVRYRPITEVLEERLAPATVRWISDTDGFWDDHTKWLDDSQVNRAPRLGDDVIIDRGLMSPTVTIRNPEDVRSLVASEALVINNSLSSSALASV